MHTTRSAGEHFANSPFDTKYKVHLPVPPPEARRNSGWAGTPKGSRTGSDANSAPSRESTKDAISFKLKLSHQRLSRKRPGFEVSRRGPVARPSIIVLFPTPQGWMYQATPVGPRGSRSEVESSFSKVFSRGPYVLRKDPWYARTVDTLSGVRVGMRSEGRQGRRQHMRRVSHADVISTPLLDSVGQSMAFHRRCWLRMARFSRAFTKNCYGGAFSPMLKRHEPSRRDTPEHQSRDRFGMKASKNATGHHSGDTRRSVQDRLVEKESTLTPVQKKSYRLTNRAKLTLLVLP